jgi:AcrR family transcriptional regulator
VATVLAEGLAAASEPDVADGGRTFNELARRAQIVDAAIAEIAEREDRGASRERIAERAGLVSTTVIDFYFASRADLESAIVNEVRRRLSDTG